MDYRVSFNFKTRYYIEPSGPFGWVFRREGSDKVIKRAKHRSLLLVFASDFVFPGVFWLVKSAFQVSAFIPHP